MNAQVQFFNFFSQHGNRKQPPPRGRNHESRFIVIEGLIYSEIRETAFILLLIIY